MKKIILFSLMAVSLPFSIACSSFTDTPLGLKSPALPVLETIDGTAIEEYSSVLSDAEISDLLFMLEEEKLAHDVYTTLYETWKLPLFQNIASSEESHMEAIQYLLNLYNISDPAANLGFGQFENNELQKLYDQLVKQGNQSLVEALKVGASIEEIDILDLQEAIANTTQSDIQRVYANLTRGSYNHLKAFANALRMQAGETYQPQYLSLEDYQSIVDGKTGKGMGFQTQGRWGGRGRQNTY